MLSSLEQQEQKFQKDGYLKVDRFAQADEVQTAIDRVQSLKNDSAKEIPAEHLFYEDRRDPDSLKQIQHLDFYDPWFSKSSLAIRVHQRAESLLSSPVLLKNVQYFNKGPGISQSTPPHQDGFYFMLDPCEAVTFWWALDDADEGNGCVRYVTGSHRLGMRQHSRSLVLGFSQSIPDFPNQNDKENEIVLPAKAGDILAHHALTIHRADANHSVDRTRRAIGFIFYSEKAKFDEAKHAEYQRQLASELKSEGKI